jgi:hypothetical protein
MSMLHTHRHRDTRSELTFLVIWQGWEGMWSEFRVLEFIVQPRLCILQDTQPGKSRNLSWLISNLSRLNWSSERYCVYCLSTVFILLQQQEVTRTCPPRNRPCLVFESINTFLTYTLLLEQLQTGQQHSSSFCRISTLLHIWLSFGIVSFGIVHSIIIYSTISKITVRPREIGAGGKG